MLATLIRWSCRCGLHWRRTVVHENYLVLTWVCDNCDRIGYSTQFEGW